MLKVGFSRVDVTPPLGSYISGYYYDRFAKGVLDPLSSMPWLVMTESAPRF